MYQKTRNFALKPIHETCRHNPPDVLRLQVSGAGATTMGAEHDVFEDEHLLEHILELPEDRIDRGADATEEEALRKIRTGCNLNAQPFSEIRYRKCRKNKETMMLS